MLPAYSNAAVAVAAVYRPALPWLERHLRVFAAAGTFGGEHLTSWAVSGGSISITSCLALAFLPCGAARRATLGRIGKALSLKSLLLLSAEDVGSLAIEALE